MKDILKSIGWNELYPETLKRITFFTNAFRKVYSVEEISDKRLNECVALSFGVYGQGMVYEIYMKANKKLEADETLSDAFKAFIEAFDKNVFKDLKPEHYINLFMEYIYSLVLKNQ